MNYLMNDSSQIFNYLKEKDDLKEKYEQLHTQVNAKYQIDQYLLKKKYVKIIAGWDSQREIIGHFLKEKEEKKVQEILLYKIYNQLILFKNIYFN